MSRGANLFSEHNGRSYTYPCLCCSSLQKCSVTTGWVFEWKASPDAPPSQRELTQNTKLQNEREASCSPILIGPTARENSRPQITHSKLAWRRRRQLCDRETPAMSAFRQKSNQLTRSFMWHSWRERTTISQFKPRSFSPVGPATFKNHKKKTIHIVEIHLAQINLRNGTAHLTQFSVHPSLFRLCRAPLAIKRNRLN